MKIIKMHGKRHVLVPMDRSGFYRTASILTVEGEEETVEPIPEANFANTGMALAGILLPGETIEDFIDRGEKFSEALRESDDTGERLAAWKKRRKAWVKNIKE